MEIYFFFHSNIFILSYNHNDALNKSHSAKSPDFVATMISKKRFKNKEFKNSQKLYRNEYKVGRLHLRLSNSIGRLHIQAITDNQLQLI
jgi:hypothetical protein